MSANQSPNWTTGPYIIQSTLLLIAPALFAASIYMELGRVILLVRGERFSIVRVNWLTKIFVAGDVLSFLMQASGGFFPFLLSSPLDCSALKLLCALPSRSSECRIVSCRVMISLTPRNPGAGLMVTASNGGSTSSASTGKTVIVGGLFVQILFFGIFLLSAMIFQHRLTSSRGGSYVSSIDHLPWRKHMFALHTSSVLILIRSVVRVIEYVQGTDGFVMSNEVFIYAFDGLLMWVMLVIFVVVHPSEVGALLKREKLRGGRGFGVDGGEPLV